MSTPLNWKNIEALPTIHGRLPFALVVREKMLQKRYAAVAVELPPSLKPKVLEGIQQLPEVHAVVYREDPYRFADQPWSEETTSSAEAVETAWFVPIDPCDAMIEALRIAERERTPMVFVDAEIEQFVGQTMVLPDPHVILTIGVDQYFHAAEPVLRKLHPETDEDRKRELHMAARLKFLAESVEGDILFLCGMAHWSRVREALESGTEEIHTGEGPSEEWIQLTSVHHDSLFHMLGEMPFVTYSYEAHRSGFDIHQYDPIQGAKELLVGARRVYESHTEPMIQMATPASMRTMLDFVRKMTVSDGRLSPDLYTMVVAAKGVVGNDFALDVLEVARLYPPNQKSAEGDDAVAGEDSSSPSDRDDSNHETGAYESEAELNMYADSVQDNLQSDLTQLVSRTPGERRELRRVRLQGRPEKVDQRRWRTAWNPSYQCSWPPEDVVIENFRSYVSSRCLSMAGIDRERTEEFCASMKDGIAMRETIRELPRKKIFVKEEPRVPGSVGAVVIIFEEDDYGSKYPWRTTWLAEHKEESTLSFYATNYLEDIVGPGIGRARYGGCMFVYPPLLIPDVWEDLRFEKARRPSERLLLAALYYSRERYVAHVSERPPSDEARGSAQAVDRHIVHIPLSSFSGPTLEKLRTVHVLNGQMVRSWAGRYIR